MKVQKLKKIYMEKIMIQINNLNSTLESTEEKISKPLERLVENIQSE